MRSAFGVDHGEISKGILTSRGEREYARRNLKPSDYAALGVGGVGAGLVAAGSPKAQIVGAGLGAGGIGYWADRNAKLVNEYRKKKGKKPRNAWGYVKGD